MKKITIENLNVFSEGGQGLFELKNQITSHDTPEKRMSALRDMSTKIDEFDNGCVSKFRAYFEIWKMMTNESMAHNGKFDDMVESFFNEKIFFALKNFKISDYSQVEVMSKSINMARQELIERLEGVKDFELWQCAKECGYYPDAAMYGYVMPMEEPIDLLDKAMRIATKKMNKDKEAISSGVYTDDNLLNANREFVNIFKYFTYLFEKEEGRFNKLMLFDKMDEFARENKDCRVRGGDNDRGLISDNKLLEGWICASNISKEVFQYILKREGVQNIQK